MKKLIVIAILSICTVLVQGQTSATIMPGSNGLAIDTVSNTGTETWTLKVPGYQKTIAVQVTATKISGTVGGSVTLQGSLDGVTYDAAASAYTATDVASQTKIFVLDNSKYLYYRVSWTGTGTMSASARCYLLARN